MKHTMAAALTAALMALSVGGALAQGAASAPGPGMGRGPGGGMQGMQMMSPEERKEHHDKMAAMTDHATCAAYMEEHHAKMVERAKERGHAMPTKPRQDPCARLKKK